MTKMPKFILHLGEPVVRYIATVKDAYERDWFAEDWWSYVVLPNPGR